MTSAEIDGKSLLLTGGTGSFGKAFVKHLATHCKPKRLVIFSRDELKQFEMAQTFSPEKYPFIEYLMGDVRDRSRLGRVLDGIDTVIHAAALKQVPAAEINPTEAIATNVQGAINIIDACIDRGVKKVVALSTDKACNPINLYGATKLCSDKLFVAGNNYSGKHPTRFSVVRYGNVIGSRGSVIPFFMKMKEKGELPITDEEMTRFFITLSDGVKLVIRALNDMEGGEIFVPKIPSMKITDVAKAVAPNAKTRVIGIRPGEKLHETLISVDDARNTVEKEHYYVILPQKANQMKSSSEKVGDGRRVAEGFQYSSHTNTQWLNERDLLGLLDTHAGEIER
ncbi:MAG: UDP-N-acetylglucosamine 4,6-dehydratase (inverting) [Oligoflexia bacterium]|nr:UDP-N-acetylglucosamine 4,6-dehydratase (inverting) [Oligoflexia bacterium]